MPRRARRAVLPQVVEPLADNRHYARTCPSPRSTYLYDVSASSANGPRACSFCVEMPISAPRPNCPPSVNAVEAFAYTASRIDAREERLDGRGARRVGRVGHDGLGMLRTVAVHVVHGLVHAGNAAHGQLGRQVLGRPVVLGRRLGLDAALRRHGAGALVGVQGHAPLAQVGEHRRQELLGRRLVHEQRLGRVAHPVAAALRVHHDGAGPLEVGAPRAGTRGSCPCPSR